MLNVNFSLQKIAIPIDRRNQLGPAGIVRGLHKILRYLEKDNFYYRASQPLSFTVVWIFL